MAADLFVGLPDYQEHAQAIMNMVAELNAIPVEA